MLNTNASIQIIRMIYRWTSLLGMLNTNASIRSSKTNPKALGLLGMLNTNASILMKKGCLLSPPSLCYKR